MARATIYKRALNVEFVACEDFDCEAFIQQIQQRVPLVARMDIARKYQELLNMVHSMNLFDDPLPGEGWAYIKGQRYLAAIIFDQGWTHDEALARMTYLVENFRARTSKLERTLKELTLRESIRSALTTISKATGKRLKGALPIGGRSRSRSRSLASGSPWQTLSQICRLAQVVKY